VMATVATATIVAATTAPDRKLISSRREYNRLLRLLPPPVPSLTTKHDTAVLAGLVGRWGPEATVARYG